MRRHCRGRGLDKREGEVLVEGEKPVEGGPKGERQATLERRPIGSLNVSMELNVSRN